MTSPRPAYDSVPRCPHCRASGSGAYSGWHRRKGPAPVLRERHGLEPWQALPSWVEHAYRLPFDHWSWCYVAEPYELDADALADLHYLGEHGFHVIVNAWRARHDPGSTLAVLIIERVRWSDEPRRATHRRGKGGRNR